MILYPPEVFNEKFLIKMRDCVLKLAESHPLKKWIKWVATIRPLKKKDQERQVFLTEIINSQFNLITDLKVKNNIINVLHKIPEDTVPELVLKSYLYIMIGNISRSDNILREIVNTPPRVNWEKTGLRTDFYHKIARDQFQQIFAKLSRHPADRKAFNLLCLYLKNYYNDPSLLKLAEDIDTSDVENKLGLKYIEGMAPSFVHFLRLSNLSDSTRFKVLRTDKYPLDEQAYWFWAFMDIDPLVSAAMTPELARLEKEDQLWLIYLLDNEKLADVFSKKSGKGFLPGRRPFLKEGLNDYRTFMMSLYKLIELGDINHDLVIKTTEQLIHE